jgi:hypothetical protein
MAITPVAGGGADLLKLAPDAAVRIQNAANRSGLTIILIGSRAAGTALEMSDYDYIVIGGNARVRHSLRGSLPAGFGALGQPRNQDLHPGPLDVSRPHIIFRGT